MAEARIRGVAINYEVVGDRGPWIALTPGSRRSYAELKNLAGLLTDCRVLLHDRRNCGASEVAFDGTASEHEVWADDLTALASYLDADRLFVGGSSAGARLAIMFALRHPRLVSGLLLWRVTGGQHAATHLAEEYYGKYAKLAKAGGMAAVCETPHFAECIEARPSNRDRLMATDPYDFVSVMERWRVAFLKASEQPVIGASEADLQSIRVPVCIIAGNDVIHTPETARKVASFLPNSEFHDDLVEQRSELLAEWDQAEWKRAEPRIASIFAATIARVAGSDMMINEGERR